MSLFALSLFEIMWQKVDILLFASNAFSKKVSFKLHECIFMRLWNLLP